MRIITEKDKRGLLVAFRTFIRALNGERIGQAAGNAIIDRALEAGVSFDALLNKENWGRAVDIIPSLSAKEYVELLAENKVEVRELTEETDWHEPSNGFDIIAEAAHDFFLEVSGKGGKWNIPSAKINLAKAIKTYSLQAILSEELIQQVCGDPETTFFNYIFTILNDFNSLTIVTEPTEAQDMRMKELEAYVESVSEKTPEKKKDDEKENEEGGLGIDVEDIEKTQSLSTDEEEDDWGNNPPEVEEPEDEDDPDILLHIYDGEGGGPQFTTHFNVSENPYTKKLNAIKVLIFSLPTQELNGLVQALKVNDGVDPMSLTIDEVVRSLADGAIDISKETPQVKQTHAMLNADLVQLFIDCVRFQGVEMNEELAERYDMLCDSWDLRDDRTRKFYKIQDLIYKKGEEDPDLLSAIKDLEKLYLGGD